MASDVLIRIGGDAKGAKAALGAAAKSIGAIGIAAAAGATAVFALTNKVTANIDEMGKMGAQLGVSTEFLSGLKQAAELGGSSIDEMKTGLIKLTKNIKDTDKGVGVAKDTFKELGISVRDSQGNLKDTEALLPELADKFQDMGVGAETTAAAIEIFGKSGAQLIPTLIGGAEGLSDAADEARRFGTIVTEDAAAAAAEFQDTLLRVRKVAAGFAQQVGTGLAPILTELGKFFLNSGIDAKSFADTIVKFTAAAVSVTIDTFRDFLRVGADVVRFYSFFTLGDAPKELQDFADGIDKFADDKAFDELNNKLAELANNTKGVGKEAKKATGPLAGLVAAGSKFDSALTTTVADAFEDGAATGIVKGAKNAKDELAILLRGAATGTATGIAQSIATAFGPEGQLAAAIIALLDKIGSDDQFIANLAASVSEGVVKGVEKLPEALKELAPRLIPEIIVPLIEAIGPAFVLGFANAIPFIVADIIKTIPLLVKVFIDVFLELAINPVFWVKIVKAFFEAILEAFGGSFGQELGSNIAKLMIASFVLAAAKAADTFGGEVTKVFKKGGNILADSIARALSAGIGGGGDGGGLLPSFQTGTDFVPRTGPAILHRGERVIPAAQNAGGTLTINVGGDSLARTIFESLAEAINNGNPEGINFSRMVVSRG